MCVCVCVCVRVHVCVCVGGWVYVGVVGLVDWGVLDSTAICCFIFSRFDKVVDCFSQQQQ